jgi:hypothetical protein
MMTDSKNTDGSAAPGTEASSQDQSELSRLISEYEGADDGKAVVKTLKSLEPVVEYVKEDRDQKTRDRFDGMIKEATAHLLEGDDLEVFKKTAKNPERLARGYLEALAREDKDFESAANDYFSGKGEKGWKAHLDSAKAAFTEEFGALKDMKAKDDAEAARLAVQGQTSEPPPDEGPSVAKMFSMSDAEWEDHMAEELSKAQG